MSTLDDRTLSLLATPSLEALSYALRHPETWPEGFEWDYGDCKTCAMGLAWRLWTQISGPYSTPCGRALELNVREAFHIFYEVGEFFDIRMSRVTPLHVAAAIDKLLAERQQS